MKVVVRIEDAQVLAGLRAVRRDLNQDVKRVFAVVGGQQVMPYVRRAAPVKTGALRRSLILRATTRGGYITTTLTKKQGRRKVGLLEYGGTRRDVIRPRTKKALLLPGGVIRANVPTARTYRAQRFIRGTLEQRQPYVVANLEIQMTRVIQGHIDRVTP